MRRDLAARAEFPRPSSVAPGPAQGAHATCDCASKRVTVRTSRRRFIAGALFAGTALGLGTDSGVAGGARSGSWCLPLSKTAREDACDFSLYELDGKGDGIFTLGELVGRPVWLKLFPSWFPPCNAEAADIVRIAGKYGDALSVIGVDVKERPEQARGFREQHKIPNRRRFADARLPRRARRYHMHLRGRSHAGSDGHLLSSAAEAGVAGDLFGETFEVVGVVSGCEDRSVGQGGSHTACGRGKAG